MAKGLGTGYWQEQLAAWSRSGLTQVAYCAKHGVNIKTFQRWRGKALAGVVPATVTLVPVKFKAANRGGTIQLHSPSGWRVELPDGNWAGLAELLRQLP